jgi:hypothetical protein
MPNPLAQPWSQLIPLIPVTDHSVLVEAAIWQPILAQHGLQRMHTAIFGNQPVVRLYRHRLLRFKYPNQNQKCLEVLLWGYPSGGRGNLHYTFLKNLNAISATAPLAQQWPAYYANLHALGNLGISTITKLAYFYQHQFNGLPSVILDLRLIEVMANGRWNGLVMPGLTYGNAHAGYPNYLQVISGLANILGCTPDQVEFTLFTFGNAF